MQKNTILGAFLSTLFLINISFGSQIIVANDNILSDKVAEKITIMGNELEQKTGVFLGVAAVSSLEGKNIKEKITEYTLNLKKPYALIFLTQKEQKLDIVNSPELDKDFDKDQVLSPMPNIGTIIPLLTSRKGKDIYNAALLNGYFDVAEQIGKSRKVELESAIGSSNKIVLNLIRYFVYGSIILVLFVTFYRKKKDKNEQE